MDTTLLLRIGTQQRIDRRGEEEIAVLGDQLVFIGFECAWIGIEIFIGAKLQWIDEDSADNTVGIRLRGLKQFHVAGVEIAHGGDQTN